MTGLVALIAIAGAVVFAYLQHPVFGSAPAGERLARIQASPHYRDGRFHNLSASFMLQTPSETIYLGGDSGHDDFFKDIAAQFPHITLAIMENGQYDEDWANIHFLPGGLIRAIKDLQPHTVLTVHHSTFELAKHDWNEPLKLLTQNAQREGIRITIPPNWRSVGRARKTPAAGGLVGLMVGY